MATTLLQRQQRRKRLKTKLGREPTGRELFAGSASFDPNFDQFTGSPKADKPDVQIAPGTGPIPVISEGIVGAPIEVPAVPEEPIEERTPEQQAEDLYNAELEAQRKKEEEELGVAISPSSLQEHVEQLTAEQQAQFEFQQQQTQGAGAIEVQDIATMQEQGRRAIAGTAAAFAPDREGQISASAPMAVQEFTTAINTRITQAARRVDLAQQARREALRRLKNAQDQQRVDLVRSARAALASAEQQIRQEQTNLLNAQAQMAQMSLETQASTRANFGAFRDIIDTGVELNPTAISGFANQLGIDWDTANAYYEGAKSIREDKTLTNEQKQVALKLQKEQLADAVAGVQTEKAKNVNYLQKLKNSGTLSTSEFQNVARGLGIELAELPEVQARIQIDQANAKIKMIEAQYAGKPPPFGTKDYWEVEKWKSDIEGNKAKLKEFDFSEGGEIANALDISLDFFKIGTEDETNRVRNRMKSLILSGKPEDVETAKQLLLARATESFDAAEQKRIQGRKNSVVRLGNLRKKLREYTGAGGPSDTFNDLSFEVDKDTGLTTGLTQSAYRKLGRQKDPQLTALQTEISALIIDYRNDVSGAAFTESEMEQYNKLFPAVKNLPEVNEAIIGQLMNTFGDFVDLSIKGKIGENNFETIFGDTTFEKEPLEVLREKASDFPDEDKETMLQMYEDGVEIEEIYERYNIPFDTPGTGGGIGYDPSRTKVKLDKLSNGSAENAVGRGIITGIDGSSLWSAGLDFVLSGGRGAKVPVPFSGKVIAAKPNGGFGNQVKIELENGDEIWFSHLDSIDVQPGQTIRAGEFIGKQGNTGSVLGGKGERLSEKQRELGRGTHLDITVRKKDGSYYSARQVAALLGDKRLKA